MSGCIRCRVSGRVQGVWFRANTREQAQRLGVSGSARNLPDGSVEVIACGEEWALAQLRDWLHQGPELARVDTLVCEALEHQHRSGFSIG